MPLPSAIRRRLAVAVPVTLLLVGLAGCAGPASDPVLEPMGTGAAVATPTSAPWGLTGCLHAVWYAMAPTGVLRNHVPEGFQLRGGAGNGLAPLGFEAFSCANGTGLDGASVPSLQYGSLFIGVDPPDEYGCDDLAGGCYVKTDVLVPDATRRAWLTEAGVSAHDGSASVTVDAAGTWTTSLVMDDVGGFGMQGAMAGSPSASQPVPFMEFMSAKDGISVWSATTKDAMTAPGAGAWSADPGTWVANEVGMVGSSQWSGGTWSFVDGSITVP